MMINVLILLTGLLICASYGLPSILCLVGAVAVSYGIGLWMHRWRWLLWVGVGAFSAMLLLLKLQPLTGMTIPAMLGFSYFSLQIISYLADIYRGKRMPERNFIRYALFMTYLPHLYIGPIQRYDPELFHNRRITWQGISDGAVRALWGGFKKLVIAARAGVIVSAISGEPERYSGAYALVAMLLYSVQLYSDFSGGMDIVLGISQMLGLRLAENFDAPYLAESFQEFWRRWHISLGSWLREYVYIPLGGNRKGGIRKVLHLLITFLASGIWHGVEYLLWGLINGIFVAFGTKLRTRWKTLNRVVTFLLISLLWSFFVWPDAATAGRMVVSVFTSFSCPDFLAQIRAMGLTFGDWVIFAAASALLFAYDGYAKKICAWYVELPAAAKTAIICMLALLILVFGMYGIGFEAEAFIYSRF